MLFQSEALDEQLRSALDSLSSFGLLGQVSNVRNLIACIDRHISDAVNLIVHHPEFQSLEGTWRGLFRLVNEAETDSMLRIKVLNAPKNDIAKSLRRYTGGLFDQSPLFKKIHDEEFGTAGGHPYSALICDYYFDQSPRDLELLRGLARIGAATHALIIAGAAPALLGMGSFQEMQNPRDIKMLFTTPDYSAWGSFRASEDSRYIGLTLPRYLARLPYGKASVPVAEFAFEEDVEGADSSVFVWSNAAYLLGCNIIRAFMLHGWFSQICGYARGGLVECLPNGQSPVVVGTSIGSPCEAEILDSQARDLGDCGLIPLLVRRDTGEVYFADCTTCHLPPDVAVKRNPAEKLVSKLNYQLSASRFVHHFRVILRYHPGCNVDPEEIECWLNAWIKRYVLPDWKLCCDEERARRPLSVGYVIVNPGAEFGSFNCKLLIEPRYQFGRSLEFVYQGDFGFVVH